MLKCLLSARAAESGFVNITACFLRDYSFYQPEILNGALHYWAQLAQKNALVKDNRIILCDGIKNDLKINLEYFNPYYRPWLRLF